MPASAPARRRAAQGQGVGTPLFMLCFTLWHGVCAGSDLTKSRLTKCRFLAAAPLPSVECCMPLHASMYFLHRAGNGRWPWPFWPPCCRPARFFFAIVIFGSRFRLCCLWRHVAALLWHCKATGGTYPSQHHQLQCRYQLLCSCWWASGAVACNESEQLSLVPLQEGFDLGVWRVSQYHHDVSFSFRARQKSSRIARLHGKSWQLATGLQAVRRLASGRSHVQGSLWEHICSQDPNRATWIHCAAMWPQPASKERRVVIVQARLRPNVISYNATISCMAEGGEGWRSLKDEMRTLKTQARSPFSSVFLHIRPIQRALSAPRLLGRREPVATGTGALCHHG